MDKGEFYLFKKIDETLYKVGIILGLSVALLLLAYSAVKIYFGEIGEYTFTLHVAMGLVVFILTPLHMVIKKNKIKKLTQEFIDILSGKEINHINNKEELLESLKSKTLHELFLVFNIDKAFLLQALDEEQIEIKSENEKLKEVAKRNAKDIYQLFILILRLHVKHSSPIKG